LKVRLADVTEKLAHLRLLEDWMRNYKPEELFDETGKLISESTELAPRGTRRMVANPHANGGVLRKDLRMPDFRRYGVELPKPGQMEVE
jgi:xylulose-5-phosphate/fructose-6-phosphate phosphoketolase